MSQSIFEQDPLPAKERRSDGSRAVVTLFVAIGGVFVAGWVVLFGVIFFGYRGGINNAGLPAIMPGVEVESVEQKQADLRTGFGSSEPGVDAATLQEIRAHFDQFGAALKDEDWAAYSDLIDFDRLMREMKKTGLMQGLTRKDERTQAESLRLSPPGLSVRWLRYAIISVKLLDSAKEEAVVYAYFWSTADFALEYRVWVAHTPTGWKSYDWEYVPFGCRTSFEKAACIKRANDPRLKDYFGGQGDIASAEAKGTAGEIDAAIETLRNVEKRARLPELSDRQLIRLAYAWWRLGQPRECLRCAREVSRPEAVPGALYLQADAHNDLRQFRLAAEFGRRYEAAAGGGPAAWQLLASVHQRLEEREQAAKYWQKLLHVDSDNVATLQSFAAQLESGDGPMLVEVLRKLSRPVELGAELAERLTWSSDPAVMRDVVEFVAGSEPDSARSAYLRGLVVQGDGDADAAAGFFKTAFQRETDAEVRTKYVMRFLDAMSAADRALAGYEEAPDPDAAFERLLSGVEEGDSGLSVANRRAVIDAHRLKRPDSPRLRYHAGLLAQTDGDRDGARREFLAAIDHAADDDERQQFRGALIGLMQQAGQELEAYQTIAPADKTFQQLIQAQRWSEGTGKIEVLKELHRLHQAAHPEDGWLDMCAAIIAKREKNFSKAVRLARHGYELSADPALKSQYQWLVVEVALAEGDFAGAYGVFADPEEALDRLGQRTSSLREWDRLKALLDWHLANQGRRSAAWRRLKAIHFWNRRDYAGVVDTLDTPSQPPVRDLAPWQAQSLDDWYVRSLLKLGRLDDAERKARAMLEDDGRVLPLILVNLANKNAAEVERLLTESRLLPHERDNLYYDSDAGPILSGVEYLAFRRKYPPALSFWRESSEVVLLLRDSPGIALESVRAAAEMTLGSDGSVEPLEPVPGNTIPGTTGQWLIQSGLNRLVVTAGSRSYHDSAANRAGRIENQALEQAVAGHQGWIEVQQIDTERGSFPGRSDRRECFQLAARLLHDDCLAVYLPQENRLIENSAELRGVLEAENPQEAMARMGVAHGLERPDEDDPADGRKRGREFQKSLDRMIMVLKNRRPEQKFEVVVVVHSGSAAELLRVELEGAKTTGYRGVNLLGTLCQPSKFLSRFAAGDPVSVSQYLIVEWSYTDGDRMVERVSRYE